MMVSIISILFPPQCLSCTQELASPAALCETCHADLPRHTALFCPICGARLALGRLLCHPGAGYRVGAVADYEDERWRAVVWALKFGNNAAAADLLGGALAGYLRGALPNLNSFFMVPVPLGKRRERERGFNQAVRIAERASHELSVPLLRDALQRIRNTPAQTNLTTREARRENVRGCFRVTNSEGIYGRNIVVVDDVTTTGATLAEAVHALRSAGARRLVAVAGLRA